MTGSLMGALVIGQKTDRGKAQVLASHCGGSGERAMPSSVLTAGGERGGERSGGGGGGGGGGAARGGEWGGERCGARGGERGGAREESDAERANK